MTPVRDALGKRFVLALAILVLLVFPLLVFVKQARSPRGPLAEIRASAFLLEAGQAYAAQQGGRFSPGGSEPSTSTEVFNHWIAAGFAEEGDFYLPRFRRHRRKANGDGILQPEENAFAVVLGVHLTAGSQRVPVLLVCPDLVERSRKEGLGRLNPRLTVAYLDGVIRRERPGRFHWWKRRAAAGDLDPNQPGDQRIVNSR